MSEADGVTSVFPATRDEALRRLDAFLPRAGRAYAENRNTDGGPDAERSVSALSPYLRYRLLTEREVIVAALDRHGPQRPRSSSPRSCGAPTSRAGWSCTRRPGHAFSVSETPCTKRWRARVAWRGP